MAQKLAGNMVPVEIDLGALPDNFFFFSGFILQLVTVKKILGPQKRIHTTEDKLIEGGRMDNLIDQYKFLNDGKPVSAIGLRFDYRKLTNLIAENLAQKKYKHLTEKDTIEDRVSYSDVLIASDDKIHLWEKMRLCQKFWKHNIKTSYIIDSNKISSLIHYCKTNQIRLLGIIKVEKAESWIVKLQIRPQENKYNKTEEIVMSFVTNLDESEQPLPEDPKNSALQKGPHQNKTQPAGKPKQNQPTSRNEGIPEDEFFEKINNLLSFLPKDTKLKSAASK